VQEYSVPNAQSSTLNTVKGAKRQAHRPRRTLGKKQDNCPPISRLHLMTGYNRATLALYAEKGVSITFEVNVDHQSGWHVLRSCIIGFR
jgi:hypothetical protein